MRGRLRLRTIPRRLRRGSMGPRFAKIGALLAVALLLRLFFAAIGASGAWFDSIDTGFFHAVLSAELGKELEESLSVFSRSSLITSQSAILASTPNYQFQLAADDGFTDNFPGTGTDNNQGSANPIPNSNQQNPNTSSGDDNEPNKDGKDSEPASSIVDQPSGTSVDNDPTIRTVTIVPSSSSGYDYADGVYIKNETDYSVDVASYLKQKPSIDLDKKGPVILIVHTHASEAYYPDGEDIYEPTDTERTDDKNYNMIRIGDEMVTMFRDRGYEAIHIREIFDYPSYNGSYTRTLKAIEEVLKEYPSIQIVLDVHRDAIVNASGINYRTVTTVDGQKAAQILLVVGTNEGGLKHPNWKKNLSLAVHLQKQLCEDTPMLMRPINLRPERFNQHATPGSLIVEVGTSSNTLQEALYAAELFTSSFCNMLDKMK